MAKHRNPQGSIIQRDSRRIPEKLDDDIFFGLTLDSDQKAFRDAIWDKNTISVFCNSRSGTGKSTIAVGVGMMLCEYGLYDSIVYVATPTVEQKQGYLPGDQEAKSAPYMTPLEDALRALNYDPRHVIATSDNIEGIKDGSAIVEFTVDTYFRGINLENKVVIVDEAQNFYFDSLKKTLTRIHDNCKVIVIGHDKQCDIIKKPERSGFVKYLESFKKYKEETGDERVKICTLTHNHRGWFSNFCDDVEPNYT